jgi:hypothetical protein
VVPFQPLAKPLEETVWNWLVPEGARSEFTDNSGAHRDVIIVRATVTVPNSIDEQSMSWRLLELADAFVSVIDPGLHPRLNPYALGDCVQQAERTAMHQGSHWFGPDSGPPLLGFDFPIRIQLDRRFT